MRPNQQNRRPRGRNNNNNGGNRKGPNPLTRSYESNGPDVKIRGSAQQVAEKYTTLWRDAQSSGDRIMAENYLQHAEHYNRIIFAAQAQMAPQRDENDDNDSDDDSDDDRGNSNESDDQSSDDNRSERADNRPQRADNRSERSDNRSGRHQNRPVSDGSGPQPVIDGVPVEVAMDEEVAGSQNANRRRRRPRRDDEQPSGDTRQVSESQRVETAGQSAVAEPAPGETVAAPAGSDEDVKRPRRPRRPRVKTEDGDSGPDSGDDKPSLEAAQ